MKTHSSLDNGHLHQCNAKLLFLAKLFIRCNFFFCVSQGSPMVFLWLNFTFTNVKLIYVKYLCFDPNLFFSPKLFFLANILFGETSFVELCLAKSHLSNFIWRGLAVLILSLALPGSPLAKPDKQKNVQTFFFFLAKICFGKTLFCEHHLTKLCLSNFISWNFIWRGLALPIPCQVLHCFF